MFRLEIVTKIGALDKEIVGLFTEPFSHVDTQLFTIHIANLKKPLTDYQERILDSYLETESILAFDYQEQ